MMRIYDTIMSNYVREREKGGRFVLLMVENYKRYGDLYRIERHGSCIFFAFSVVVFKMPPQQINDD
jgi:hypothetical protein